MAAHDRSMPPLNEWDDLRPLAPTGLSKGQWDQLKQLHTLLVDWNQKINLTRLIELPSFINGHVLDSWQLCAHIIEKSPKNILDIGSGGGFPALILAITFPDCHITALDSAGKKTTAIQAMADELGLKNVTTLTGRAEEFGLNPEYREKFDLVVSRAVADLTRLLEYCVPFVKPSGYFLALKTQHALTTELPQSLTAQNLLAVSHIETLDTNANGNLPGHILMTFLKNQSTPAGYPRRSAHIQKHPL